MNVLKLAAFSLNGKGGNPAGVVFYDGMPSNEEMLKIAKEVGYSETAFLVKQETIGESVAVRARREIFPMN
jgi:PhzF family phenazine biosynthesis protein